MCILTLFEIGIIASIIALIVLFIWGLVRFSNWLGEVLDEIEREKDDGGGYV